MGLEVAEMIEPIVECNTSLSAYILYRHIRQFCSQPFICIKGGKYCGKKEKCCLTALSPFPKIMQFVNKINASNDWKISHVKLY